MNILLLGATGSIGDSVLSVIEENHSELNLFGITFHKNINKSQEIICLLYTSPSPRDED